MANKRDKSKETQQQQQQEVPAVTAPAGNGDADVGTMTPEGKDVLTLSDGNKLAPVRYLNGQPQYEMYGVPIDPSKVDVNRVFSAASRLGDAIEIAHKAHGYLERKKRAIADTILDVARTCKNREEFNTAYAITTARYEVTHGTNKFPPSWRVTAAAIKSFYDDGIDVNTINPVTQQLLSFSDLQKAQAAVKKQRNEKIKAAEQMRVPQWKRAWDAVISQYGPFLVPPESGDWPQNQPLIEEATKALVEILDEHKAKGAGAAQEAEPADLQDTLRQEG